MTQQELINFIWGIANKLCGSLAAPLAYGRDADNPHLVAAMKAELRELEGEIVALLGEVAR